MAQQSHTDEGTEQLTIDTESSGPTSINHAGGDAEHGFDLTNVGSAHGFKKLLYEAGLDPEDDFHKVDKRPNEPDREWNSFVWANEHVMLITSNNPITGEHSAPVMKSPEKGYAGYIGIEGKPDHVSLAADSVHERAMGIKAENEDRREFI